MRRTIADPPQIWNRRARIQASDTPPKRVSSTANPFSFHGLTPLNFLLHASFKRRLLLIILLAWPINQASSELVEDGENFSPSKSSVLVDTEYWRFTHDPLLKIDTDEESAVFILNSEPIAQLFFPGTTQGKYFATRREDSQNIFMALLFEANTKNKIESLPNITRLINIKNSNTSSRGWIRNKTVAVSIESSDLIYHCNLNVHDEKHLKYFIEVMKTLFIKSAHKNNEALRPREITPRKLPD
jgi:hypothetical protein